MINLKESVFPTDGEDIKEIRKRYLQFPNRREKEQKLLYFYKKILMDELNWVNDILKEQKRERVR